MDFECDILGLGTVLVDHQVVIPAYPIADVKIEVCSHRRQVGGPVPTALTLLSRWGRRCAFIGKWGHDEAGEFIRADLSSEGLELRHSLQVAGSTGFAHVWIDRVTGSRTVAAWRGDFGPIESQDLPESLPNCRVLHLDGWSGRAAIAAAKRVKSRGGLVVLDTGSPKPEMEELLSMVDVVNCPRRFMSLFSRWPADISEADAASDLLSMGPRAVIVTNGDRGAVTYWPDGTHVQPAFPVHTMDSTGAGDVFCGALIHGLLEDWPIDRCTQFAAASAALKCQQMGNREALPSKQAVFDYLENTRT